MSSDSDGYITNWFWNFDDNTTGNGEIITKTYTKPGIYNVELTVTDNDNATDKDNITIIINA